MADPAVSRPGHRRSRGAPRDRSPRVGGPPGGPASGAGEPGPQDPGRSRAQEGEQAPGPPDGHSPGRQRHLRLHRDHAAEPRQARTPQEQEEFVGLFAGLLEQSYISKIETYSGEKITFLGDSTDGDVAVVRTRVISKQGTEIPIDYRMRGANGRWLAYDVSIEGISLIGNYRTQFDRVIQKSSYQELAKTLRAKQDERLAADGPRPGPPPPPPPPPAPSPHSTARPIATTSAPSAKALITSVPREKPPSTTMLARPATASTTAGRASMGGWGRF